MQMLPPTMAFQGSASATNEQFHFDVNFMIVNTMFFFQFTDKLYNYKQKVCFLDIQESLHAKLRMKSLLKGECLRWGIFKTFFY